MTVIHGRKNVLAIPRLPPPLRKKAERHTSNNQPLRRSSRLSSRFQICNIKNDILVGSPSSPSSSPSPSPSPLSSTEIITPPLLLLPCLQDNTPGLGITKKLANLSICDLSSSLSPPANELSNSKSANPTAFLDFLNRLQQGTEPVFDRGDNHKDYIQIPQEYLLDPHPPLGSPFQPHFFNQCYPDTSMYGSHMILTRYPRQAEKYNMEGFHRLSSASDEVIYRDVRIAIPKRRDPILCDFMRQPPHIGSGRPLHSLRLKVGCPIMLLQNVSGVCAGTRLIVEKLEKNVITAREAVVVGGSGVGREGRVIEIGRHPFKESNGVRPIISYTRLQFPIKHAFALAVDDVPEGVMFEGLGLDLYYDMDKPGQLHSALSRCRDPSRLKVYIRKTWINGLNGQYTRNVLGAAKK